MSALIIACSVVGVAIVVVGSLAIVLGLLELSNWILGRILLHLRAHAAFLEFLSARRRGSHRADQKE